MKNYLSSPVALCLMFVFLFALAGFALAADPPPVSLVFVELKHQLDFSKAEAGQTVELTLARDLVVEKRVVAQKGALLISHVERVNALGKHLRLHLVLDHINVGERKIDVTGIVVAIAPGSHADLANDPHYGMMASNQPNRNDPDRMVSSEASPATGVAAKLHKSGDISFNLQEDSQGVIGMDAKLEWVLDSPPPVTVIEAKSKKFTLEPGTQMLIRMAQPK